MSAMNDFKVHMPIEIVRLPDEQRHTILFTPPYHRNFQPIEVLWALKGNDGRQYETVTIYSKE